MLNVNTHYDITQLYMYTITVQLDVAALCISHDYINKLPNNSGQTATTNPIIIFYLKLQVCKVT